MTLETFIDKLLEHLFTGYLENHGTPRFDLAPLIIENGMDVSEVAKYMMNHGYIKHQYIGHDSFSASISNAGIKQIRPNYFSDKLESVVQSIGLLGIDGGYSLLTLLNSAPEEFQLAFDIGKQLESTGLLHVHFIHNDVIVELTDDGKDYYNTNKGGFFD